MELQPKDKEHHSLRTSAASSPSDTTADTLPSSSSTVTSTSKLTFTPTSPSTQSDISTSVPALRFPKPQGNPRLANWLSNSSPDLFQLPTMSDTSSLADSAYEIIGPVTDTEDHEVALSESVSSLEVSRPDDVHSLDGSDDRYDTDTGDESDASDNSSIRYAEQLLDNPSSHHAKNKHIIELREIEDRGSGPQLYSHGEYVIREYSEEETATIAREYGIDNPPKRLAASISQVMFRSGLSVQEPLRVLYVGPTEPKREIILKIGEALWASPVNDTRDGVTFGRHREGVYNIVPISSFGSTPELDLMEASHYQIMVDHCTSISKFEPESLADPTQAEYSVTIGHETEYEVVTSRLGATPPSKFPVPHIAIFFITEDESVEDTRTRSLAMDLARDLGIESIVISESQSFVTPPTDDSLEVSKLSPHICLHSMDPQESFAEVRLPIDFPSFLNIDASQLNRNLAWITGLHGLTNNEPTMGGVGASKFNELSWTKLRQDGIKFFHNWPLTALLLPVIMTLLLSLFGGFGNFTIWDSPLSNQTSSLSGIAGIAPSTTPVVTVTSTSLKPHTSTTTVVINVTSTKTIELGKVQPSTSTLASALSFAGFLSDKPSVAPGETPAKKTMCSAHVYGPKEILVTLPSANKEWWLSKGAIDINVWRSNTPLQVRLSSVDEGILINLGQNEGYGSFNVTVVTTRKPKINETFVVDFGRPMYVEAVSAGFQALFDLAKVVSSTTNDAVHMVEDTCAPAAAKLRGEASFIKDQLVGAGKSAHGCYEESVNRVKRSLSTEDMTKFFKDSKDQWSRQVKAAQDLRDVSILHAQIASKLWWLQIQGRKEEYDEYKKNTTRLLQSKYSQSGGEQSSAKDAPKDATCSGIFGKRRCMQQLKESASSRDATRDSRWKKKIMG